ncbi:hypothetical protein [Hydrogenovibrio marinus]|uniref:Uncharacterized protein n=1 Tax=Hydrogenovibrio marinus TaxID=28885 RepID=A0A066ZRE5_HYDMR|nr:hypothetical protein [Hydrogenovibrio marinus]KDN94834.1 hypothetical protein EI16_00525 [Hydrogenovibrio marinus]BBN59293.1 hypothetical protein HVMH_0887 [Hydrogenovibrio marinus]
MSRKAQWVTVAIIFFLLALFFMLMFAVASVSEDEQSQKNAVSNDTVKQAYLETAGIDLNAVLKNSLPKDMSYMKGRVDKVSIDMDKLKDNLLVIRLNVIPDHRKEYMVDRMMFDRDMILSIAKNSIKYLVKIGQSPDDKGFSIRVSATMISPNKTPTGKEIWLPIGVARYSPSAVHINYQAGHF